LFSADVTPKTINPLDPIDAGPYDVPLPENVSLAWIKELPELYTYTLSGVFV
jgi:hypothetical protein